MTTGEGGCITTDDDNIAALCRSMRNQGRAVRERMEHVRLGYNYRMDELAAALGCAQLERLPGLLAARRRVAEAYHDALAPYADSLMLPANPEALANLPGEQPIPITRSWFVYVVQLRKEFAGPRQRRSTETSARPRHRVCIVLSKHTFTTLLPGAVWLQTRRLPGL